MNKIHNLHIVSPNAYAELHHTIPCYRNKSKRFAWSPLLAFMTCAALVLLSGNQSVFAQTFDDAISAQLLRNPLTNLGCARLVGGSPRGGGGEPTEFGVELAEICGPVIGGGGLPESGSTAGGATSATADVEERLRALREDECVQGQECEQDEGTGASTVADLGAGRSVWFSADYQALDRDITDFEDGYDSDIIAMTVGVEWQIENSWVAGAAFNISRWEGDFESGGEFETDSYGPIFYSSFYPSEGFFVDVVLSLARKDISNERSRIFFREDDELKGGSISAGPNDDEFSLSFLLGWDYSVRQYTIGPRFSFDYIYTNFDGYSEKGTTVPTGLELKFDADSQVSLQTRFGVQASMAISKTFGVVVPQASLDWIHEYANDQRSISVRFVQDLRDNPTKFSFQTDKPDRDFFELSLGLSFVLANDIQAFGNASTILNHDFIDSYTISFGLRKQF